MGNGGYRNNSDKKDFSEQIFDLVMNSVEQMDFSGLSGQLRETINNTRDEFLRHLGSFQIGYQTGSQNRQGSTSHFRTARPRYRKRPSAEIVVSEKKLPGTYSGPLQIAAGAAGLAVFGGLSLGFSLAQTVFGSMPGILTAGTAVIEITFLPLTILSGIVLGRGIFSRKRVRRIRTYLSQWADRSYIMLADISRESGQSLKQIRRDIGYLLKRQLLPGARMDQEETCLMLTDEAIRQYEAAKESQRIREEEERRKQQEAEQWANASEEEKDMLSFVRQAKAALQELTEYENAISSEVVTGKLEQLKLLLTRIFVCVKEHPEKLRLTRRLMNYYLPSVMKLLSVYRDLEDQPIQGENIRKTRTDIEASLDTINDALESMFDELFQEEALDVSADIQVLRAMLAQDGWISPAFEASKDQPESL